MIRFLLLYRIDWTDEHPGLMLVCVCVLIVLYGFLDGVTA